MPNLTERESKQWYVVNDRCKVEVHTGFSCEPDNPDYWWLPTFGASVPASRLYESKAAARAAALAKAKAERKRLKATIAQLESDERNADA